MNSVRIEQEILETIVAAKLRLRFDKVALRLVGGLQTALATVVPDGRAVIFTVTAPIRLPAKTAAALEIMVRAGFAGTETVHGNDVRVRWVAEISAGMPKVLGFVHNPTPNADLILELAEARISSNANSARLP